MVLVKLSKQYGEQAVFKDFNIELTKGKIHTILGPSGCGKSTLLKCIAGLESYEGQIDIDPNNLSYVFQEDRLFPWFTVDKNLKIINDDHPLIDNYLNRFKVYDLKRKFPSQLSGGERQRISIIRACIYNKPIILLDEPFKSLDYNLKWEIVNMLAELQKEKQATVILITHDIDVSLYLSDLIFVLSNKPTSVKLQVENIKKESLKSEFAMKKRIHIMEAL
ncbi:ABC transporter ATP-binding protein [Haloplasma contractile]|uniref:Sulfate-thiosulfate import ATP-binding protein CysA n=1 Tax=Haloplasma contractile SSD-17B TaxID=1033810 RepID=U2E886_9MOLU|nr:ATP-binding cassette domain-containing protein [Haloplasma contractile]ERJ11101.1 Sulfate-thiosulfate import ATP-binding protein CysA [Haloplasma contractile SSD-17B]